MIKRAWSGPFEKRAYRWLWPAMTAASIGAWGQIVGAQWLFVHDPNGAEIISLIQTAATLPVLLLVLPAGVLADAFDKRWILVVVQCYVVLLSGGLALVTHLGFTDAPIVLLFLFALNIGASVQAPTWQPLVAETLPAEQLSTAVRLDVLAGNLGRAVGPVIAGLLISSVGPAAVFGLNALTAVVFVTVLLTWRRKPVRHDDREHFLLALRAGRRFVRYDPGVIAILARLAIYAIPASALWVLLPLIASRQLGLNAASYGVLYALAGLGAAAGALLPGILRRRMPPNRIVTLATLLFGVAFGATQLVSWWPVVAPLLVLSAVTWTVVVATTNAELHVLLPAWVRARGLAALMMVFTGAQAIASPVWGFLVPAIGLFATTLAASLTMLGGLMVGRLLPLPSGGAPDQRPLVYWRNVPVVDLSGVQAGTVVMELEYTVAPDRDEQFLDAMAELRRSRLRSGALRWEVARILDTTTYVERVSYSSWEDHVRQVRSRLTAQDKTAEDTVISFTCAPPKTRYLLKPSLRLDARH